MDRLIEEALGGILVKATEMQNWQSEELGTFKKSLRHYQAETVYTEALNFFEQDATYELLSAVSALEEHEIYTSYRLKSEQSFLNKWRKESNAQRPLKKVANDILGVRLIINEEKLPIEQVIVMLEKSEYEILTVNFYDSPKSNDDGYRGVHFYLQENTRTFPIEIQVWDYKAALLNFYAHEVIYKNKETGKAERDYALAVQQVLQAFPQKPENMDLSFVDYIFEVLYKHMKGGEEDG